jgi:hypothetical protein
MVMISITSEEKSLSALDHDPALRAFSSVSTVTCIPYDGVNNILSFFSLFKTDDRECDVPVATSG